MHKICKVLIVMSVFSIQQAFADDVSSMMMGSDSDRPCADIVKACIAGGYTQKGSEDKRFWADCMKPILMNKPVTGIDIPAATVQECRSKKIDEYKKDLQDLQSITSNK